MAFIVQKEKPTACDDCWFTWLKENHYKGTSGILCDIADEKHKNEFLDSTTVPNWCPLKKYCELKTWMIHNKNGETLTIRAESICDLPDSFTTVKDAEPSCTISATEIDDLPFEHVMSVREYNESLKRQYGKEEDNE